MNRPSIVSPIDVRGETSRRPGESLAAIKSAKFLGIRKSLVTSTRPSSAASPNTSKKTVIHVLMDEIRPWALHVFGICEGKLNDANLRSLLRLFRFLGLIPNRSLELPDCAFHPQLPLGSTK
jgi:hypothetical protein